MPSDDGPGLNCQFATLSPEFGDTYGTYGSARWVNVLKVRNYGSHDTLALTLPSSFTHETALVSREGFVLPQKYKHHGEFFGFITGKEALTDWLEHRGIHAEPADPSRIADQILSSLKGFRGANLLADRHTLKLLDKMAKSIRKHADGNIEEYPDRSIAVKSWADLVKRRASARHGYGVALDSFIEARVLRLGLVLTCTNCQKNNWFGIENLKEKVTCERCLNTFLFPQGSLNFRSTPWQYRVIGPYSVPNYAEGA